MFGSFFINLAFFSPLFYIPDMAVSMGVERTNANFLLSIYGEFNYILILNIKPLSNKNISMYHLYLSAIANVIGHSGCGWLSDRSCVSCLSVYNTTVFLSGITIFFMPFCYSYVLYVSVISIYGFFNGFVSLEAIVLVELFGKNV